MKIRIMYDNKPTYLEVPDEDFALMIDMDYEDRLSSAEDKETVTRRSPQEIMDERFNRPDYNNWHKLDRHSATTTPPKKLNGKRGYTKANDDNEDKNIKENTIELYPDNSNEEVREKENINTGSMESELMLSILSGLAESESISISENTKWAIQRRFQNGTFKISYPPYGYQNIDGQMIVNPKQAEVVMYIFAEVLSGKGTQKVANDLNQKGIPSKRGGRWTATTIRGILTNEKYTGDVLLQKTYTDSHFNRHTNYGEENMYLVENHHEAIISHEDFEAVDAILNQRAKEKGIEKRNSKYLNRYSFSSKIICSECGSTFKRRIHSSGSRKYIAWCCSKHISNITECSMQFIRDEDIKTAFVTMMNKLIFGQKFILRPLWQGLRNQNNVASFRRIEELETKIENNMEQSQVLTGLMVKGYLEPALFNKEKNALEAERERLLAEKDQLTRSVNGNFAKVDEVDRLLKFATKSKMLTAYEDELFEDYVERIIVFSREEVGFELRCGITLKERLVN